MEDAVVEMEDAVGEVEDVEVEEVEDVEVEEVEDVVGVETHTKIDWYMILLFDKFNGIISNCF